MKKHNIRLLLFTTIAIVTLGPLLGSFYYLDKILNKSLSLGFNAEVLQAIETASSSLRRLAQLDPANSMEYRANFESVENLHKVYQNPDFLKSTLESSLKQYFLLGVAGSIIIAFILAYGLSRRIDRSYRLMFDTLSKEKDKVSYLEDISSWQNLAKMLAHEIKNPLTPIEVTTSSLAQNHLRQSHEDFHQYLVKVEKLVTEEIQHLKNIVNQFGDFSKVPAVKPQVENLTEYLGELIPTLRTLFPEITIHFAGDKLTDTIMCNIDKTLFRQVFINLIQNAIEANPSSTPAIRLYLQHDKNGISVTVSNNGRPIPEDLSTTLFEPYVTSKRSSANMGLGLTVVKKVVVEHGGSIDYKEVNGEPCFSISLPRVNG